MEGVKDGQHFVQTEVTESRFTGGRRKTLFTPRDYTCMFRVTKLGNVNFRLYTRLTPLKLKR